MEHRNSGTNRSELNFDIFDDAVNLSKDAARVYEQNLINKYGLGTKGGQLFNKINSISEKNWFKFGIQ
ncbi:MAG: hypothetical protein ACOYMA_02955 [Bacteroidia bacterium]